MPLMNVSTIRIAFAHRFMSSFVEILRSDKQAGLVRLKTVSFVSECLSATERSPRERLGIAADFGLVDRIADRSKSGQ